MAVPPRPVAPELLTEARRLYEQTSVPVRDIAAMVGLAERTLYTRIWKWKWRMRKDRIPAEPPPAPPEDGENEQAPAHASAPPIPEPAAAPPAAFSFRPQRAAEEENVSVAVRLQRVIERQMAATERLIEKLSPSAADAGEATKAAQALSLLVRLTREQQAIGAPAKSEGKDEQQPRSDDELRSELVREVEAALAAQSGEGSGGAEA